MPHRDLTTEPKLDEALADSIVQAIMASDCVSMAELRRVLERARRKLSAEAEDLAA